MKLIDLKDLSREDFKAFSVPQALTAEERAEVARLYMACLTESDLNQYADWEKATSFDDFLRDLKEQQRQWDEQPR